MTTRVLIVAGGTGGHVFPALAVATQLMAHGIEVAWMGTRTGLEAELVAKAGIPISFIDIGGLRSKGMLHWLRAPWRIVRACIQARTALRQIAPDAVLGMGGFVTGPAGVGARLLGMPLVIHEQNAVAGLTNQLLAPLAKRVLQAFPGALPGRYRPVVTGNPVRTEIAELAPPAQRLQHRHGALRLLVLGGSLGARALNEVVPSCLHALIHRASAQLPTPDIEVWHQTGARNIDAARASYGSHALTGRIVPFITDMAAAYGWADLVLCRAGALTIAELACAGVASILVPYPYAVDDHQTRNAQYLTGAGGAVLVAQNDLTPAYLAELLVHFSHARDRLQTMAHAARECAQPDAAAHVAAVCLEVAHG